MTKKQGLKVIDTKAIKKAPYNPRSMGAATKQALKASLTQFEDISGIVVNSRTGNLVAGNHRWEQLCGIHGESKLTIEALGDSGFHQILGSGKFTGFIMRVVDWPIEKEKAANIAANSPLISGEFTSGLQQVISDIQENMGAEFDAL